MKLCLYTEIKLVTVVSCSFSRVTKIAEYSSDLTLSAFRMADDTRKEIVSLLADRIKSTKLGCPRGCFSFS